MKADTDDAMPRPLDLIERAHLKDPRDASHVMHRYEPTAPLTALVQRFWIPVWSVPPGAEAQQKVLQYPVCLLVVTSEYARFYGVASGLSTTTLRGDGWAVGALCTPAAGYLIAQEAVTACTDRFVDLPDVLGAAGAALVDRVRDAMAADPHAPAAHARAIAAFDDALRPLLPVDDEGRLVDRIVAFVEQSTDVTRVAQICEAFALSDRSLQRIVRRRLGLTPKWLVQRRRLQEAAERLRQQRTSLAQTAAALGYADQAHFTRDFSRVTGMTPGAFAATHGSDRDGRGSAGQDVRTG